MEVIIQHNFNAGFGDYTNVIYRYFHLVDKMRENGIEKIGLYISFQGTVMFEKDFIFKLYNKTLFENTFDEIEITDVAITDDVYKGLTYFCPNGGKRIGVDEFDIFIDQSIPFFEYFKNNYYPYFFNIEETKFTDFFSDYVMDRYEKTNPYKNQDYKTLHFRSKDFHDIVEQYNDNLDDYKDIIFNKGRVFVCSNSYAFKEFIKSFNSPNVFMYDLKFEKEYGNHLGKLLYSDGFGKNEYEDKTIDAAIEFLTIADSNEIFSFNYFGNLQSLFLSLAKWKSKKINIIPLKNGLNWKSSV
jgi:hypothetical protein